jgi:hypothetical protein
MARLRASITSTDPGIHDALPSVRTRWIFVKRPRAVGVEEGLSGTFVKRVGVKRSEVATFLTSTRCLGADRPRSRFPETRHSMVHEPPKDGVTLWIGLRLPGQPDHLGR